MMTDGATNVERCTSHVHVDWNLNVRSEDLKTQENVSQTFEIGNQSYFLMFLVDRDLSCLSLYRKGPPVQRSIRWRAGLKHPDGSYHHRHGSGDLNLEDDNRLSFEPYQLLEFYSCGCIKNSSHPEAPCNVTVYFQVEVEAESAGTNACTQESAERMFPPSDGQIYEKECSCCKHVEWTIEYDLDRESCWVSPIFVTGNQRFRFVYSGGSDGLLELFRLGSSVDDPGISVWCWAGLKRGDGTYHHRNEKHRLLEQNECEVWTQMKELMCFTHDNIVNYHLDRNKRLTFFLRMTEETGAEPCTFGHPEEFPRGVGSIKQEMLSPYMLVEWTFRFESTMGYSSPVFVVDNQNYVFELHSGSSLASIFLTRMGPAADRDVLYTAVLRRSDDIYKIVGSECGHLNLGKAADLFLHCDVIIVSELPDAEKVGEYTLDFLLLCGESPVAGTPYTSSVCQVDEDWINSPERDSSVVLFKIEDMAFKIHKAPILVFVPVFKRMLTNDCIESKTGVVTIEDCKPIVFKEFLESVEHGFRSEPSADNALALYQVANKYLIRELENMCSKSIEENLSLDNFCDVLELCFAYNDENLLAFASAFLSRNRDIIESVSFSDVSSRYPDDMNKLMRKVFPE